MGACQRERREPLGPILDGLEKEAAAVLAHRHRGLPEFDAEAFANVVFHELLENVAEHAGESVSHCLVTIWARSKGTYTIPGDYLTAEQPFFTEWASRNDLPLVEAVVGDSGVGLTACLRTAHDGVPEPREGVPDIFRDARGRTTRPTDEQSVLFWSMGRWTSRRPQDVSRGTRGLHRAHRLVQSYKGMITLRSGTTIAGWDHREGEEHPLADKGLGAAPGTVACVRFSLCERAARPVAKRTLGATDTCYFLAPSLDLSSGGISTPELEGIRLVYDLWIDPETGDDVSQCPWLEHVPGTDRYVCRIHDLKPDHCRKYPTSRRHADETGCPGFEGCRQGLYADETGGHIPVH